MGGDARPGARRALALAWRAAPREMVLTAGLALAAGILTPLTILAGKYLVNAVVPSAGSRASDRGHVLLIVVGIASLVSLQRALASVLGHRKVVFSWLVALAAERQFLEHAADVDLPYLDESEWYDRVTRATRDLDWRPFQLADLTISFLGTGVTFVGLLALLATLNPLVSILAVLSVVPAAMFQRRVNRDVYKFWQGMTAEEREQRYFAELLARPDHAKELRAFGLRGYFLDRHKGIASRRLVHLRSTYARADRLALISAVASGFALGGAYWFVAARALDGQMSAGDLAVLIGAFAGVSAQLGQTFGSLVLLDEHRLFLRDYFAVLDAPRRVLMPSTPRTLPPTLTSGVSFDSVSFTYPGGVVALRDLTLRIDEGEVVAIVGENGAGKSTLVKLLLRLYDPDSGRVELGGIDLRDVHPDELRRRIGVLFQDYGRYELTLRENVAIGRVDRRPTDKSINAALRAARASDVTGPDATLDARVGRMFEGGHDLSGGQWQRLALARLVFRAADVWILDEPTSALDPKAEALFFGNVRRQLTGRTGLIISHRFSTVRLADRIAVLDRGKLSELGSHEELIANGGRYAAMFQLQAGAYQ